MVFVLDGVGDAKTVSNTVRVLRGEGEALAEGLGLALALALGDAEGLATAIVATAGIVLAPVVATAQL
ncbi:hypothetical protein GCM10011574_13020 [Microbispora bryophytorum]|uniref:Uncharacterized protein n=1 Tax=Microbispora bryophytorum TaxID=1460882 RepID=A0A8H9LBZ3_9ACTN|nr:hypothetical protein GCM10011574_13020 [Microbispora bryophytorum]